LYSAQYQNYIAARKAFVPTWRGMAIAHKGS
jgi:hypothetical protein